MAHLLSPYRHHERSRAALPLLASLAFGWLVAACGGGGSGSAPPPSSAVPVPPTITQQPADLTATGVFAQLPFDWLGAGKTALAVYAMGRIVVGETGAAEVGRIDSAGNVTPLAGLPTVGGSVDGVGSVAKVANAGAGVAISGTAGST